jgi:hypothetical protein
VRFAFSLGALSKARRGLGLETKRDGPAFPGKSLEGGGGSGSGVRLGWTKLWSRRKIMFMSQELSLGNILREVWGTFYVLRLEV